MKTRRGSDKDRRAKKGKLATMENLGSVTETSRYTEQRTSLLKAVFKFESLV